MMQPISPIASGDRPRFRQDLLAESVDEHGATFIDVMDPDSGNVFRFYEVEFSLACAMDGERDVPGLVRWAQDELGVAPSPGEVREVIATLGELGYLDHTAKARAAASDTSTTSRDAAVEEMITDDRTTPVPPRAATPTPAPAPLGDAVPSEVSLNLSDHVEVGPADVQEAVRQSRVMTAVEPPQTDEFEDSLAMPAEPFPVAPPRPVEVKPAPAPAPAKQPVQVPRRPEVPKQADEPPPRIVSRHELPTVEQPPLERPLELMMDRSADRPAAKAAEPAAMDRPTARERPAERPERPAAVIVDTPVPPAAAKSAERPAESRKPVELPKEPPKIAEPVPVVPQAPERRMSPALIVVLVIVVLGLGAFLVWRFALSQSSDSAATSAAGTPEKIAMSAPPAPPPVEEKPPVATSKIELATGTPKAILAFFAGTIEWIAASDKNVQPNDVIMKLRGAKPIEAQLATLAKDVEKRKQELDAAIKARDAAANDAAKQRASAKVAQLEKLHNDKSEALTKKQDQLEPYLVRPPIEGKLTVTRKVGEQIRENTPIATVLSPPAPSATFAVPEGTAMEVGLEVALRQGEKLLTCSVAESEPGKIRMKCPPESGAVEGAAVTWELPRI